MNLRKELEMVQKYNKMNGTKYEMIVDDFEGEYWFQDECGNKLSAVEEKKIWEYYEA